MTSQDFYKDLWNFDMSQAPKSYFETKMQSLKGRPKPLTVTISIHLWVAYDGNKVGKTKWLPDQERWEGFKKDEQPEAWLHYPTYPGVS